MRWLGMLVVVLALLPGVANAADSLNVAGCPGSGYLFEVPKTWVQISEVGCPGSFYRMSDKSTVIAVWAERHGYWNDARSNASIRGDTKLVGKTLEDWSWRAFVIGKRTWYTGTNKTMSPNGVLNDYVEGETYAMGFLYKFTALTNASASFAVEDARLKTCGAIWKTVTIFKV